MSKGWRFRAWPEAGFAELIDLHDATAEEERRALSPGRAAWVLRSLGSALDAGSAESHRLRALVHEVGGIGRLTPLRERDLLGVLERQVQSGRLLVVTEARAMPVMSLLQMEAAVPEVSEPAPPPSPAPREEPVVVEAPPDFPNPAAQARVMREAARDGVPFCEECERARRAREASGAGAPAGGP
jgi:hypothetical protein